VWAVDFQFDETSDRRRIKLFNIVDEHTREALAIRVARTCTGEDVVTALSQIISERGAPAYLRADNGPELIAWTLRDYCRMTLMCTSYIEPGAWSYPVLVDTVGLGGFRLLFFFFFFFFFFFDCD
jgi:putative transposase